VSRLRLLSIAGGHLRIPLLAVGLALSWLLSDPWVASARGDGGTLRLRKRQGPFEIAVFTAPDPFVAGPVDISVLVLDGASGEPVLNAKVRVTVEPLGRPDEAFTHEATSEAATNKLLHAAVFDLPTSGVWLVEVALEASDARNAQVRFKLKAGHAAPGWMDLWPWVCWPVPVILLYGIHQRLVWRKGRPRRGLWSMNDLPSPSAYNSCHVNASDTDGHIARRSG
jgi:hypothetical protein